MEENPYGFKKYLYLCGVNINMNRKKCLAAVLGLMCAVMASAQTEVRSEAQVTAATGDHNPLWLNANKYGLSSLSLSNGYLRVGGFRPIETDSVRRWAVGYGADMAFTWNMNLPAVVQQAFVEGRWMRVHLTVGSKEQPVQLKDQELSSGSQTLGINARPFPSIRLELPDYWSIPGLRDWVAIKGHVAFGLQTDDQWQKKFTAEKTRYTKHTHVHTKAGYLRIGQTRRPLTLEVGLEMGCQYGGRSFVPVEGGDMMEYKNSSGLKGMWHALIPSGYEANEAEIIYKNADGNHLGSMVARVNLDYQSWGVSAYADHFFEDHSQLFFFANNGYGEGDDWDKKVDNRYFVYDIRDMMLGLELRLKQTPWLSKLVAEYLYTKYQSGPIYHDHTENVPDQIAGRDDYYNHYMFTGWQHWGQVVGNPLYRSPQYNNDGYIMVRNNRFEAVHLAIKGDPLSSLHYRLMYTWQKGFGTYLFPLPSPQKNVSMLAEVTFTPQKSKVLQGWAFKVAAGLDHGGLLGDNAGVQLTVARKLNVEE